MSTEIGKAAKKIRWDAISIGITSFVVGGAISFLITLLVHPLH